MPLKPGLVPMHLKLSPLILVQLMLAGVVLGAAVATAQALPGCEDHCGNVSIPYPFGTKEGCYMDFQFLVTCNRTNITAPKLYLQNSTIKVIDISLSGQLRISAWVGWDCYDEEGRQYGIFEPWIQMNRFLISNTRNKFTAVGCDTYATVKRSGTGRDYTTGCLSLCDSINSTINGSCSGIGCCQTSIPQGVGSYQISISSYNNHSSVVQFNPCSFAFVAEEGSYVFLSTDLSNNLRNSWKVGFPLVLDWAVGSERCDVAKKNLTTYACKSNSVCYETPDFVDDPGYHCNCSKGYEGNPYLPNGCQDIDECNSSIPCYGYCVNSPGSYNCSCPKGYEGDATKNGGCRRIIGSPNNGSSNKSLLLTKIALGVSISISMLLFGSFSLYWGFRQRRIIKLRERFFQENGGIMLQQKLSRGEGSAQSTKIFTAEDLKKATNNYHESQVLGKGGHGTVYKGILPNNTVVAIKKSIVIDQSEIEQFINEVIVLSQVNHKNVVKIVGCCLETEVPLLVYEFVPNGTLYDHLHNTSKFTSVIPWETRLRIAAESAGALFYLHSVASTPIIHRDVKTANILLDQSYTAKVSDFGASRLVPVDQSQLTTMVQGTLGYLDPEYFQSSQLTEKSDVYSFGVVLMELITGKKALSFDSPEEERNLAKYFIFSMEEDRLFEIADKRVINEAMADQIKEVAILAKRCIKIKGDERPTMKEVAMELDGLIMMGKHPWVKDNKNLEETQYLLGELSDANVDGVSTSNSAAYDSLRNYAISAFDGGDGR